MTALLRNRLARILTILVLMAGAAIAIAYFIFAPRQDNSVTEFWSAAAAESTQTVDHQLWQDVLDNYLVTDDPSGVALFDYQGLLDDGSEELNSYLEQLAAIDPRELNRAEQFAYWVNLYNALTVQIVISNYPIASIKEVGSSPLPVGPWNDPAISIAGQSLTLNHIEHSILRPIWEDYRIHFAVNCASVGCPDLQAEAFTAANTEALLNLASESYLNHQRGLNLSPDRLILSSIFSWYAEDFGNSETQVLKTLSEHLPQELAAKLAEYSGAIEYDYNWQLNEIGE